MPVVTIVLLVAAIVSPLIPFIIDSGGAFATIMVVVVPPLLGIIGGGFAMFSRSLMKSDRIGWAVVSVVVGFATVAIAFQIATRMIGP